MISIHALLAESDKQRNRAKIANHHFYPRSPCGERRTGIGPWPSRSNFYPRSPCGERRDIDLTDFNKAVFLSTLSLRRATDKDQVVKCLAHISIHALLAESDILDSDSRRDRQRISIHALLAESDLVLSCGWCGVGMLFLSTLSLRRATLVPHQQKCSNRISIHALLAESDSAKMRRWENRR